MFDPIALKQLRDIHSDTLNDLLELRRTLNARFFGMEKPIHAMILAAMTGEAMVMIGPPGTSKSRLVRAFCQLLGLIDKDAMRGTIGDGVTEEINDQNYFEYLLTQFTEPSELFGHYDLKLLFSPDPEERAFVRDSTGMMQTAEVVFLDEVFNASSAILNALLTFMNERKFHDRGRVIHTPMRLLFSATNHPPREEGLGAVFDRFLLRSRLENVVASRANTLVSSLGELADAAWRETHAPKLDDESRFPNLLDRLDRYRDDVDEKTSRGDLVVRRDDRMFIDLADVVTGVTKNNLSLMSNRRIVKFMAVFLANALLRSAETGTDPRMVSADLEVILDYGLDVEDASTIEKLRQNLRMKV